MANLIYNTEEFLRLMLDSGDNKTQTESPLMFVIYIIMHFI